MNEDSLPKMKTLFGAPLPALSPSDGERVASGRVRGTFTLEDRLGVRIPPPQSSAPLLQRLQRGHFHKFRNSQRDLFYEIQNHAACRSPAVTGHYLRRFV